MNKEEKIVPQLRFPEFEKEWKLTKLKNVVELLSGYAFKDLTYIKGGRKLLIPKNFTNFGYASFNNENTKYTSQNPDSKYKCKNGDLLILLTDLTPSCELLGKPLFLLEKDGEVLLNQRISKVITSDKIYSRFLLYFFLTDAFHKRIKNTATGSTVKHSSNKIILNSPISLPTKKEQQKIAACLSSLDEVITAESEKLDLLQDHKKGLLQQLFPAEGETQPKFRFPEFKDDGDWEETTLGELAKFRRGSFPQPYGLEEWYDDENGMPFIQVYDVDTNLKIKPKTKRLISELAAQQSVFIEKGTVIITIQGSIGRVAITQYDAYIDRTLLLFQKFYKATDKLFFAYVIQMLFEIEKQKAPGGIIKTITKEVLTSFVIKLPKIQEQQKIAACLSAADELIEAQAQKIEALQAHKKGLLQQLFPSLNDEL